MKKCIIMILLLCFCLKGFSWGFYGHKLINYYAVFLLPPEMMVFYKKNILFLSEHAVDPDKRRYAINEEGPRHYIDMDRYGPAPWKIPHKWKDAVEMYTEDSLRMHGIVPWWIQIMLARLTTAFKNKDAAKIRKLSAELGHYIADSHVPLHASSNHNGQLTNQHGIHGFWESRIPELLAEKEWDFFLGKADYIKTPLDYTWDRVLESAAAADSVLWLERKLNDSFPSDRKYAFENRNGVMMKQYSSGYTIMYNLMMNDMVERRMRQSIYTVACFWYTAWVNAGQPDLRKLSDTGFSEVESKNFEELNLKWKTEKIKGRSCD
ncbi:MAG: S1/P1 Nuclease [Chitinophagaceae bacterium]|nr:S1/P1 Nuclease [Chitinophagaceae bacterium]